ncbi:MAG: SocA family protein [Phycisphaerales bacterium]|nr:SocA family protein [Phycisphaerales bacterium]
MSKPIDNRKDVLLLLLYSPGKTNQFNEPIVGRTRLTKLLFLFKEEALEHFRAGTSITEDNFYRFFAWNFGPFSRDVYDDLTFFELRGFIERREADEEALPEAAAEWDRWLDLSRAESADDSISEYDEQEFRLTAKGEAFAKPLYDSLSGEQRKLLKAFKAKLAKAPLKAVLEYVYTNYPDQTTKSQIKEQVLGRHSF